MKNMRWALNGIPIIFDNNGHLIDGHHRLQAIIQAGVPVEMCVCRGVDSSCFPTIDIGLNRKFGQLLAMHGCKGYNNVASTVSVNMALIKYGRPSLNRGGQSLKTTNPELYQEYLTDEEGYKDATIFGQSMYGKARMIRCSWISGLVYYLTHTGGYDTEYVRKFFDAACSIETSNISSADCLSNYIIKNDRKNKKTIMNPDFLFAIIIKSWNAYVSGKIINRLSFNPEKEDYPKLNLNTQKYTISFKESIDV